MFIAAARRDPIVAGGACDCAGSSLKSKIHQKPPQANASLEEAHEHPKKNRFNFLASLPKLEVTKRGKKCLHGDFR
jgi:hypothetical protein